jgi:hypothetical protein
MSDRFTVALALLVTAIARWLTASAVVQRDGMFTKGGAVNPAYYAEAKAADKVLALLREFGCTPASLSGIRLPPGTRADNPDDLSRFFKGAA